MASREEGRSGKKALYQTLLGSFASGVSRGRSSTISRPNLTTASESLTGILSQQMRLEAQGQRNGAHALDASISLDPSAPAPALSALLKQAGNAQRIEILQKLAHDVKVYDGVDPLAVWLEASFTLADDQPLDVRLSSLSLLTSCATTSLALSESVSGRGAAERAVFWAAVLRFASDCQVLNLSELTATVGAVNALCKGGRDIQGLEGLVALLCTIVNEQAARRSDLRRRFAEKEAPNVPFGPPLLDPTGKTPFVHISPNAPEIALHATQSSIALLTDIHKFSWGHLSDADLELAASTIVEYGMRTTSDIGVQLALAFIDTTAKFGLLPDAQMPGIIELVARVVGIEHIMTCLQGGVGGLTIVRPLQTDLAQYARTSMRNLLLSPANLALEHLRNAAGAFVLPEAPKQAPVWVVLGAVRCLRRTLADYYQQALIPDKPPTFEVLPTLINLGMTLLQDDLLRALDQPSPEIALEVLGLLEDRFACAPAPTAADAASSTPPPGVALDYDEWDMVVILLEKISKHFPTYHAADGEAFVIDLVADATEFAASGKRYGSMLVAFRAIFARTVAAFGETSWVGPVDDVCKLFAFLRPYLTPDSLTVLLDFYSTEALCMPSEPAWLERIADVTHVAVKCRHVAARRRAVELLIDVFDAVRDDLGNRNKLVQLHLLPFFQELLRPEVVKQTYQIEIGGPLAGLLNAVLDDAITWADPLPEESAAADADDPSGRVFDKLLENVVSIASMQWAPAVLPSTSSRSHVRQASEPSAYAPSLSQSVASLPTPASSYLSRIDSPNAFMATVLVTAFFAAMSKRTTESSMRAIIIFRQLLQLLDPKGPAPRKVKLLILAMLLRLRADARHRLHFLADVDIDSFAQSIDRAGTAAVDHYSPGAAPPADRADERRGRHKPRQAMPSPDRSGSRSASRPRQERSPSRSPPTESGWATTDTLPFPIPEHLRSGVHGGLVSYDNTIEWSESQAATQTSEFPDFDLALASRAVDAVVLLPVSEYLRRICSLLEHERDWEILSYVLCYLPDQLTNKHFAAGPRASKELHKLRTLLCADIKRDKLSSPVILPVSVKTGDVHALACQSLSTLIAYRSLFTKEQQEEMVETFAQGLRRRDIARPCLQALTVACHELSHCMPAYLHVILQGLALIITTESISVHALEFIASVGLQPNLFRSFTDKEYLAVFAIALQYISLHHRDAASAEQVAILVAASNPSPHKAPQLEAPQARTPQAQAFAAYVLHMAYYNLALWFVSSRFGARREYYKFIAQKLVEATECRGGLDEAAEVYLDMLARYVTSNVRPSARASEFRKATVGNDLERRSELPKKTWLVGQALMTWIRVEPTRWTEVTIRRASGVVKVLLEIENGCAADDAADTDILELVQQHREEFGDLALPFVNGADDQPRRPLLEISQGMQDVVSPSAIYEAKTRATGESAVSESFLPVQFSSYPDFGTTGPPILLPKETPANSWYGSSIRSLDNTPVIDAHAVGVLYVGPGQTEELDIFANSHGSKTYLQMLHGLGDMVRLKGYEGYTGGLDRSEDLDGKWMLTWGNNVVQMVFHVATLIPGNRETDPQLIGRKRHLGNDAVKVVYNDSGGPYDFRTVKGQFNWVNIVVEPHTPAGKSWSAAGMSSNEAFFKVYIQLDPSMPELGPLGSFKMVSAASLGQVIRHLALHADMYAKVHLSEVGFETSHGQQKVEFTSNWRKRLQIIKSVRKRLVEQKLYKTASSTG